MPRDGLRTTPHSWSGAWLGLLFLSAPVALAIAGWVLRDPGIGPMLAAPSLGHPLGTDDLGHDLLVLLARGAGVSLAIGVLATAIALVVGGGLGLLAGFGGRLADDLVMRSAELTVTVPPVLLAIVLVSLLGAGELLTALALGLGSWPTVGRVARAAALGLRGQPHILAARALGLSRTRIALRHVLPAILPVLLSLAGVLFSGAVLAEATLSFVGLADHSTPGWGEIMAHAGPYLRDAWWLWLFPGLLLIMATTGVALLADEARPSAA